MAEKKLRIIPIGGLGEIGKNMTVVEYGKNILIVDVGIMFPEFDMPGIDHIIPDWGYLDDKKERVVGIVFTHGHEDHVGAIRYMMDYLDVPLYGTPFTMGVVERKLKGAKSKSRINVVEPGGKISLGPFDVEFFNVCHSVPDASGLGITTPAGLIVHTGDFKLDNTPTLGIPTDMGKLSEFASRGVLALLSDSTNADRPGYTPSEAIIDGALRTVFSDAEGRIIVASFSSLVSRVQQVINAAAQFGRRVSLVGTSMVENSKLALKLGHLKDPEGVIIPLSEGLKLPKDKLVIMSTGSQGERSSILGRLSRGQNRDFDAMEGDTIVVSAHAIPGNEEQVSRTINSLIQRGARVIYDPILPVHVSGHAHSEEQKQLLNILRPKYFVPVHGELRHLHAHAGLAQQVGIKPENIATVENGRVLEFTQNSMHIGERVPGRYIYVDGTGIGDIGPAVLRERNRLGEDGFVIVNMLVDMDTGELIEDPELISRGFVFVRDSKGLFNDAKSRIVREVESGGNGSLRKRVEQTVSDFFYGEMRRRPLVFALINQV